VSIGSTYSGNSLDELLQLTKNNNIKIIDLYITLILKKNMTFAGLLFFFCSVDY